MRLTQPTLSVNFTRQHEMVEMLSELELLKKIQPKLNLMKLDENTFSGALGTYTKKFMTGIHCCTGMLVFMKISH